MKILILNWKDPAHPRAGGAERYVSAIARIWSLDGHDVTLFTSRLSGRPRREIVDDISYLRYGSPTTTFHWARRFLQRSGAEYDCVLECVSTRPYFAHRYVRNRATALYMQMADDVWHQEFPQPVAWVGRRLVEPTWVRRMRSANVVAISPSTANDLARFGIRVAGVAPPGCDLPHSPPVGRSPRHPARLLFIGRLVRTKRPHDAVEAFRLVAATLPGTSLDIVGDGYFSAALAEGLPAGARLRGWVSDPVKSELLGMADLVLLPGTREGWGIVAIEAAAYGVPVVGYDIPGLRDSIVDQTTGVLTECRPDAMARAAIDLLTDEERWRRLSEAASARASRYAWSATSRHLLDLMARAPQREPSAAA